MDNQKRLDPQEASSFFKDKRAMRLPVKGTVARGFLKGDDHFYRGKKGDVFFRTLPRQVKLSKALLQRGQDRYNIFCSTCHGYNGNGKGAVTRYTKALKPKNLRDDERIRKMAPGEIYSVIANGKMTGNTINMPSYRSQLTVKDRWAVVAYVRALQLAPTSALKKVKN
jgi:mono/diheme cytochrome c family protein